MGDTCDEHNHDVSKTFYNHLLIQRKQHDDDKVKAHKLLSVKANKKIVQHHLAETTGEAVLLNDIHNINTEIRPKLDSAAEMRNLSSWLDSRTDLFVQYVTDAANEVGESGANCNNYNIFVFLQVIINFMNEVILSS